MSNVEVEALMFGIFYSTLFDMKLKWINLAAIIIPVFFLIVFLMNPAFGDPLLLVAIIGMFIMLIMLFVGVIVIYRRSLLRKQDKYYLPVGIMNLSFGISGIICQVAQEFVYRFFLFEFAMLLAGLFIIGEYFLQNKRAKKV